MHFLAQPLGKVRLGDFLLANLTEIQWTTFRAAVAFVKRSGTQYIRQALQDFSHRAHVRISVGVDLYGTSGEALTDLLQATSPDEVFVYRNNGPFTFHPKVYLFKSAVRAVVLTGSGNLTAGGLFTNYEASVAVSLDLAEPEDAAFLAVVEATLDTWSQPQQGTCYALTPQLIDQLVTAGLVRSEAELAVMQQSLAAALPPQLPASSVPAEPTAQPAAPQVPAPTPLFISVTVPGPPPITAPPAPTAAVEANAEAVSGATELPSATALLPPGIVPLQMGGATCFVMTLQNTDVGVGQATEGTSRRSPEVFIPLAALDLDPGFWTFPDQFSEDVAWNNAHPQDRRNGLGKMDRMTVSMRIGTVQTVSMFFNPRKKDFRLRNETLRSSGKVGDILLVRRVDPVNGFDYDIQVAPQGSPLYQQIAPFCNTSVPNSLKRFGYF